MPAPATIDHVSENVGLCSTYSMRTRSGPQRNAAYVFAASTTDSTSIPSSLGVGDHLVGRVDEHGEVIQQRPLAARPGRRRGTRRTRRRPRRAPARRARSRSARTRPRCSPGSLEQSATWSRSYSTSVWRLDERDADAVAGVEHLGRPVRQLRAGGAEVGDAQARRARTPRLARPLGVEQRQLAAAGVAAEQGEVLLARRSRACPGAARGTRRSARGRRPRRRRGRESSAARRPNDSDASRLRETPAPGPRMATGPGSPAAVTLRCVARRARPRSRLAGAGLAGRRSCCACVLRACACSGALLRGRSCGPCASRAVASRAVPSCERSLFAVLRFAAPAVLRAALLAPSSSCGRCAFAVALPAVRLAGGVLLAVPRLLGRALAAAVFLAVVLRAAASSAPFVLRARCVDLLRVVRFRPSAVLRGPLLRGGLLAAATSWRRLLLSLRLFFAPASLRDCRAHAERVELWRSYASPSVTRNACRRNGGRGSAISCDSSMLTRPTFVGGVRRRFAQRVGVGRP